MDQPTPLPRDAIDRALKPFALPLGLASPMWLAYGAAASVGATWWWMSRMSRFVAPHADAMVNAEAIAHDTSAPDTSSVPKVAAIVEPVIAIAEPLVQTIDTVADAVEVSVSAAPLTLVEPAATPVLDETSGEQFDELTLLRGVGPRVADALVARGVTTFAQLASWTEREMVHFDTELKLLGRSKRYDFLGQARERASQAN